MQEKHLFLCASVVKRENVYAQRDIGFSALFCFIIDVEDCEYKDNILNT